MPLSMLSMSLLYYCEIIPNSQVTLEVLDNFQVIQSEPAGTNSLLLISFVLPCREAVQSNRNFAEALVPEIFFHGIYTMQQRPK